LDAYEEDILHNGNKMKVHAKIDFKLLNLDVEHTFALVKVIVNLVALVKELKLLNFVILMSLKDSQWELKPQGAKQPFDCILNSFNKFLKVIIDELFDSLPLYIQVDHEIEKVFNLTLSPKALIG